MKVGLLGVGRMGVQHAETLVALGVDLTVADADSARATAVAGSLGVPVAHGVEELLGHVDAVVIATPTPTHAELVTVAAAAGIPIFCEKPLAFDVARSEAAVAAAATAGVPLQVGFQRRFDGAHRAAAALVRDGAVGTIYLVRTTSHDREPPPEAFIATSGGMFADVHLHDFDAISYVTGQAATEVYADGTVLVRDYFAALGDVDTSLAVLRLSGGALAVLTGTRHAALGYDIRMELFGSKDSVLVADGEVLLRRAEGAALAFDEDAGAYRAAYEAEMRAFLALAAGEAENEAPGELAVAAIRVAIAAERSRAERRPVQIGEIS